MNNRIVNVLEAIEAAYREEIQKGGRHYVEVDVGQQAERLGYPELKEKYSGTFAVVPLKGPRGGMKVRIDGRSFAHYAEYASGMAVPGYLAKEAGRAYKTYIPLDSMVCNFC
jgi:hypothetical protein